MDSRDEDQPRRLGRLVWSRRNGYMGFSRMGIGGYDGSDAILDVPLATSLDSTAFSVGSGGYTDYPDPALGSDPRLHLGELGGGVITSRGLDFRPGPSSSEGISRNNPYVHRAGFWSSLDTVSGSDPRLQGWLGGGATGRTSSGPDFGPGLWSSEGISRNNPNVRPREGDWICPDPACRNLNFAWRKHCNKCDWIRPPPTETTMNADRYPPSRGLPRDGPREYVSAALPPPRHEGRFPYDHVRRERVDYMDDGYRGRNPMDWSHRDRGRHLFSNERVGFGRRLPSPTAPLSTPLPSHRGRWAYDVRGRSRSPLRSGPPP